MSEMTEEVVDKETDKRKKDLWGKLARRRREKQQGTLSQNFIRNFKKLQSYMESENAEQEAPSETAVVNHKLQTVRKKINRF